MQPDMSRVLYDSTCIQSPEKTKQTSHWQRVVRWGLIRDKGLLFGVIKTPGTRYSGWLHCLWMYLKKRTETKTQICTLLKDKLSDIYCYKIKKFIFQRNISQREKYLSFSLFLTFSTFLIRHSLKTLQVWRGMCNKHSYNVYL